MWNLIIERMEKKLNKWKGNLLSLGGRLTLLKASLSTLRLYYLSIFPIPRGVADKIIKIQRQFLWCGTFGKKYLALAPRNLVKFPKALGGLGVGDLLHKNLGLLCKWIWRLMNDTTHYGPDWCEKNTNMGLYFQYGISPLHPRVGSGKTYALHYYATLVLKRWWYQIFERKLVVGKALYSDIKLGGRDSIKIGFPKTILY